ncbi:hypothetical protein MD273_18700 [Marinobacter pelagius]|uniref:hypothetical protein n=1 Tax=Marinobacter sp. C7 TaxID=2951363 RepID=UPI001EF064AE|nr:hypothetical protein [Marinobacter sp. C7]MCG7201761.1 hypothetical protein [Marinobacter sp. C7]
MENFETRLFIDGRFEAGEGAAEIAYEPATGEALAHVASASAGQPTIRAPSTFRRLSRR